MKAESTQKPQNKVEFENHINDKIDAIFFDEIIEADNENVNFQMYRITIPYRKGIEDEINENYKYWLDYAKKQEYEELAKEIRAKRDKLLEETDKEMVLDRMNLKAPESSSFGAWLSFLKTLSNAITGDMANYRQQLRDLTKQDGFPYDVKFPKKPDKEE